jgi:hypothetical protein
VLRSQFQLGWIYVDGGDGCAQRSSDLNAKSAYATHADEDCHIIGANSGAAYRLPGCSHCIRDHGETLSTQAGRQWFGHRTQTAGRDTNVSSETTVAIVTGHKLTAADGGPPGPASRTDTARDDSRNDNRASDPSCGFVTGGDYVPADFVPEHERKGLSRRHATHSEANVGVADTTAGNLDNDFFRSGFERWKLNPFQRLTRGHQPIPISSVNSHIPSRLLPAEIGW